MASILGSSIITSVLGHSEAEKAFRTWWDTLKDSMIYSLVVLGLLVIPTAIIMGTPLSCNYCQNNFCGKHFSNIKIIHNETVALEDPNFSLSWATKYCTLNGSVKAFMLYFPYFLLSSAISLVIIERVFSKMFKSGLKMEKFYKLLVHQKVLNNDFTNEMEANDSDYGREDVELRQSFYESNNYYVSYLTRTLLEIVVGAVLLFIMFAEGFPSIDIHDLIHCNVHGYWYECSGAPNQFYLYILYITVFIDAFYVVVNVYNLLWLTFPGFGALNNIMMRYRKNLLNIMKGKSEKEVLGDLFHIYYNNRDLKLLLELLTISSGIAPAISIITFFDKSFQNATKATILKINTSKELGLVRLEFEEAAPALLEALVGAPGLHLWYVAEIIPKTDTGVKTFQSKEWRRGKGRNGNVGKKNKIERKSVTFGGLKQDVEYSVKVSTVVNGRTISQVVQEIKSAGESVPEALSRLIVEGLNKNEPTSSLIPIDKRKKAMEVQEDRDPRV